MDATAHYERVTDVWRRYVMGEDLHFGLFAQRGEPLAAATERLTDHLIDALAPSAGQSVLDVGCGVGAPAVRLAEREDCSVTGISTSAAGLAAARARRPARGQVEFRQVDAVATGFEADRFDGVFSLESAHLIVPHDALFRELYRVLRPGGRLALCDVTLVAALEDRWPEVEGYRAMGFSAGAAMHIQRALHGTMHRAFGTTRLTEAVVYRDQADAAGFVDIELVNLSAAVQPTLQRWADAASVHAEAITAALGAEYLDDFFLAIFHMAMGWGRLGGYVILTANKPE